MTLVAEVAAVVDATTVPALVVQGASKTFGSARVLSDLSLTIARGEVRALIGANGSGKSTFIKLLSGYHSPDRPFHYDVGGVTLPTPPSHTQLTAAGVRFVHQHLPFAPEMSVLENVCLGTIAGGGVEPFRWRAEAKRVRALLDRYGLTEIGVRQSVGSLTAVQQTLLALVTAFDGTDEGHTALIVLDEVTASLPADGVARVHELVRAGQARGLGFLVVSHRLDELRDLADTVTGLRDGRVVLNALMDDVDHEALVAAIVSTPGTRAPASGGQEHYRNHGEAALIAERVSGPRCRDLSFEVAEGEILGITGLVGMGQEEIAPLIYGLIPGTGHVTLPTGGNTLDLAHHTPATALASGIGFLSGDRARYGGWAGASVVANLTLPYVGRFFRRLRLNHRREADFARRTIERLAVSPQRIDLNLGMLSGGNQQKVLMGRALEVAERVLVLDEPTAGVDIGARGELVSGLREYAAQGRSIIYTCSDAEEIAEVCDRVLVLHQGRIVSEIVRPFTASAIVDEVWRERSSEAGDAHVA